MDNLVREQEAIEAEHGLSFYVKTGDIRILFDFGAGRHVLENALRLGIRPEQIDVAVGNHRHCDYAAGYRGFVAAGLSYPLVTENDFFEEEYTRNDLKAIYLEAGSDSLLLEKHGIRHMMYDSVPLIGRGCQAVDGITRSHDFEAVPERFVTRDRDGWKQDYFQNEVCLVLEDKGELMIIVDYNHPGIPNTLDAVSKRSPQPICAVVGGTHLVEVDRERIHITLRTMKNLGIGLLGFDYRSEELLQSMMAKHLELDAVYLGAGDCLLL